MRHALSAGLALLALCQHAQAGDSTPVATPAPLLVTEGDAICTAQRAENRRRAEDARCTVDRECVHAEQYDTGRCDSWVAGPDAEEVLRQLRTATDAACREEGKVVVTPACPAVAGACVGGRCTAKPAKDSKGVAPSVPALPEDLRCVATALKRITSEQELPLGKVALRFPLTPDGRPPRYFEDLGSVGAEAAVGVARAFGWCRWRLEKGGPIKPGTWGAMTLTLGK
jgi:dienelactone hydrolase